MGGAGIVACATMRPVDGRGIDGSLVRERFAAQLLSGPPAGSVAEVVDRLLAVQAQDRRGFRLAVRSRSTVAEGSAVDAALDARAVVVGWLLRGTLHLVGRDDYWWLHALTAPRQRTGNRRRLAEEGVSDPQAARGVQVVTGALADGAACSRAALRELLDAAGVPTAGQAIVHVLHRASIEGRLVRGPVVGGEQHFVDPTTWIGPAPPTDGLDRDALLARLARRYLAGHGPAEPVDLAAWSGLPLRDAHRGFELIADETDDRPAGCVALRRRGGRAARPPLPPPRLLGPFDPLLHGWKSRAFVVGPYGDVVTVNGVFRPIALVDGRAVATWRLDGGTLTVTPREPLPAAVLDELTRDGAAVLRYLGLPSRPVLVTETGP